MLDINRVLKEDPLLRAFTGLNRKAFDELSQALEIVISQKPGKRSVGIANKLKLQSICQ